MLVGFLVALLALLVPSLLGVSAGVGSYGLGSSPAAAQDDDDDDDRDDDDDDDDDDRSTPAAPATAQDDDDDDDRDDDRGQAPIGGADTGLGGTADDGTALPISLAFGGAALAAGGLTFARRSSANRV